MELNTDYLVNTFAMMLIMCWWYSYLVVDDMSSLAILPTFEILDSRSSYPDHLLL